MPASIMRFLAVLCLAGSVACNASSEVVALPDPVVDAPLAKARSSETVVLAGGCFWGIQAVYQHVKGVTSAVSGYSGGTAATADYETVSSGSTTHAESVKVTFDPAQVSLGQILKIFFSVAHNPTELNRQGPDTGTQYRSVIFFIGEEQKRITRAYIDQLNRAKVFPRAIVTEVAAMQAFYPAEAYHQNYATLHPNQPYIAINDLPKVEHLRQMFPAQYREK
ncbi:MAG TPA: peptide-methionine (S)-S-oxide reductase MsrA [Candidatus Saccharimonadales bacterium]|nr:peptide-methionine (S)-S-oxide reductase MsrA [Candidatus Saccharimonadales bacterium]